MAYNPNEAKDGKMAFEGGDPSMHHETNLHDQSGKKKERSPGVDKFDTAGKNLDRMTNGDMVAIRRRLGAQGMSDAEINKWYGQF